MSADSSHRSPDSADNVKIKIALVGACNTGAKTNLANRYVFNTFSESFPSTIGASFFVKKTVVDGIDFTLEIWGL